MNGYRGKRTTRVQEWGRMARKIMARDKRHTFKTQALAEAAQDAADETIDDDPDATPIPSEKSTPMSYRGPSAR